MSETTQMQEQQKEDRFIASNKRIPYALIKEEVDSSQDVYQEFLEIMRYYNIYEKGASFTPEGTSGDYVASNLKYKISASLINKEARFLFAETPDVKIDPKGDVGKVTQEAKNAITVLQDLVKTVLDKNKFEDQLIKAARDCFIGKRVAGVVNFNEESGVTVTFLRSIDFVFEFDINDRSKLSKFVAFIIVRNRKSLKDKRILKKKFEMNGNVCMMEEILYDGGGNVIEEVTPYQATELDFIPAVVFVNDGLTGEDSGISEVKQVMDYESAFSKLSNADIDSERKSMNPIKYSVDMDVTSTRHLSTAPGSYWDLQSNENKDKAVPSVGMLESDLSYSEALKVTLDRIKGSAYGELDVPNIEEMQAKITSGKELKAIYWPLIVRCKEKMKMWGPQLRFLVDCIIKGAFVYQNCIERYTDDKLVPVAYEISIENNYPLPEDEAEEKQSDLMEVNSQVMSRKAYMKKWRLLTDDEADAELEQMAKEKEMFDSTGTGIEGMGAKQIGSDSEEIDFEQDQ